VDDDGKTTILNANSSASNDQLLGSGFIDAQGLR
jgi:hypothetical protein